MAKKSATPAAIKSPPTHDPQELVMYLEHDQLSEDTAIALPRAVTSKRVNAGLWTLRVFVTLLAIIVIYTFAAHLK